MEWKTEFDEHSLQHLANVWEMFSCNCLKSNSPSTTWLHRVHKGCVSITWLVPSDLVPQLIKSTEMNMKFFYKHHILKVTVGDQCVYEEERSTSVSITFSIQTSFCLVPVDHSVLFYQPIGKSQLVVLEPNVWMLHV